MLKKDFSTTTLVLIPVAIAINIAVGQLVYGVLKLPLYLDSIGTVLVGVLAGPWAGALTGLLSNLIWGLMGNVTYAPFAAVAAIIGLLAGLFAEAHWFRVWWKVLVAGVITGLVAAFVSAPIAAYVFGGVTGGGTDVLVAAFRQAGLDVLGASMAQGTMSDPLDKAVTFMVVWGIVRALPVRFVARFPRAESVS